MCAGDPKGHLKHEDNESRTYTGQVKGEVYPLELSVTSFFLTNYGSLSFPLLSYLCSGIAIPKAPSGWASAELDLGRQPCAMSTYSRERASEASLYNI